MLLGNKPRAKNMLSGSTSHRIIFYVNKRDAWIGHMRWARNPLLFSWRPDLRLASFKDEKSFSTFFGLATRQLPFAISIFSAAPQLFHFRFLLPSPAHNPLSLTKPITTTSLPPICLTTASFHFPSHSQPTQTGPPAQPPLSSTKQTGDRPTASFFNRSRPFFISQRRQLKERTKNRLVNKLIKTNCCLGLSFSFVSGEDRSPPAEKILRK